MERFIDVYHFHLTEETENYIFVSYFVSSSMKREDVYLMEKAGDELVLRNHFEIGSCGGELIQYEGEFYFISWEENGFLDITEGLRIHRLNGNPEEETLCICYWPDEYIWSELPYYHEIYYEKAVCDYVEQLKKEFAQGRYLRREDFVTTEIYYGDEKNWESLALNDYGTMAYKVDIANCGLPVYVWKAMVRESRKQSGLFGYCCSTERICGDRRTCKGNNPLTRVNAGGKNMISKNGGYYETILGSSN